MGYRVSLQDRGDKADNGLLIAMRCAPQARSSSPTVAGLAQGLQLKGNSLLMTLFGDAIAPRQQLIWLGTLIELAQQFGLSARLVRTSVYRLVNDGWLVASRDGRRSYYRLSPNGQRRVADGHNRIHSNAGVPPDTRRWTLLMISGALKASARLQLQRELLWNGYGQIAQRVYARTEADPHCLQHILQANHAADHVCVMQADGYGTPATRPLHALRGDCCCEQRMADAWRRFTQRFTPLQAWPGVLSERDAFLLRTLLVHEFRRVLQSQPILPYVRLPDEPAPGQARRLFDQLYQRLLAPSERWLDRALPGPAVAATPALLPRGLTMHTPAQPVLRQ